MNSNVTKIAPKLHLTCEHIWSFKQKRVQG